MTFVYKNNLKIRTESYKRNNIINQLELTEYIHRYESRNSFINKGAMEG